MRRERAVVRATQQAPCSGRCKSRPARAISGGHTLGRAEVTAARSSWRAPSARRLLVTRVDGGARRRERRQDADGGDSDGTRQGWNGSSRHGLRVREGRALGHGLRQGEAVASRERLEREHNRDTAQRAAPGEPRDRALELGDIVNRGLERGAELALSSTPARAEANDRSHEGQYETRTAQ